MNVLGMNKDYTVRGHFCSILYTHIHTSGFQSFGISQLSIRDCEHKVRNSGHSENLKNTLGWHWSMTLQKFQMYTAVIHHLCVALCAQHSEASLPLSPCIWPPLPPSNSSHSPSPLVATLLLSVSPGLVGWLVACFLFYIPHVNNIIWFLSGLFCLAWDSQDSPMLSQVAVFHPFYGWVVFYCKYVPHLLYLIIS